MSNNTAATRIYLAGPADEDEIDAITARLHGQGFDVVLRASGMSLHHQLEQMLGSQALAVTETWWTDERTYTLQLISGWVGMETYNHLGEVVATRTRKKSADA